MKSTTEHLTAPAAAVAAPHQHNKITLDFGPSDMQAHCPLCGTAIITEDKLTAAPCSHLLLAWDSLVGEVTGEPVVYTAPRIEAAAEAAEDEIAKHDETAEGDEWAGDTDKAIEILLAHVDDADQNMFSLELTCHRQACMGSIDGTLNLVFSHPEE